MIWEGQDSIIGFAAGRCHFSFKSKHTHHMGCVINQSVRGSCVYIAQGAQHSRVIYSLIDEGDEVSLIPTIYYLSEVTREGPRDRVPPPRYSRPREYKINVSHRLHLGKRKTTPAEGSICDTERGDRCSKESLLLW